MVFGHIFGHSRRRPVGRTGACSANGIPAGDALDLAGVVLQAPCRTSRILFLSTRRDGRSLGDMIRSEMGPSLLLSSYLFYRWLALCRQGAGGKPWGISRWSHIPIALLMGIIPLHSPRPHRGNVGHWLCPADGCVDLCRTETNSFMSERICAAIIAYGFIASVLPVWLLLAPRDYLSIFKITITMLAIGIIIVPSRIRMPTPP